MELTGTELFVNALKSEGVEMVFGYPGGYVIDIFDELYRQDSIEVILPRHEQGLVHAADGYARSTGKTGVCVVTSGPGATNLVTGIAAANYDSVPLVCFTAQVPTRLIGNDAFQEADIVGITRSVCKHSVMVRDRKDLNRIIKEAFYIARTGKPGPVVVDLPKDVMAAMGDGEYPRDVNIRGYKPKIEIHTGQMLKALEMLHSAQRPLFLIGGGVNIARAGGELTKLVDITNVPVVTTIMGKGAIDSAHPMYIGNLGMHGSYAANLAVSRCDLLFSIGTRFNDRITGKASEFAPEAKIVHIDIDTAAISRNVKVDVPIVADAKIALTKMLAYARECDVKGWIEQIGIWKREYADSAGNGRNLPPKAIFAKLNAFFPEGIFVTDVGQHQMWAAQYLDLNENKRLLTSGGLGVMGYGLPAAIGACLGNPGKRVVCIAGDGGFQMNIQELATAAINGLPLIICVFNNGYLGMVRQWQELFYGKRYSATCLRRRRSCGRRCGGPNENCPAYTPDFMKLAEGYGAAGIRVESADGIEPALRKAAENTAAPTVLEFILDMEELVMPMVANGKPLQEMLLGAEEAI